LISDHKFHRLKFAPTQ